MIRTSRVSHYANNFGICSAVGTANPKITLPFKNNFYNENFWDFMVIAVFK
jgi:hypothetical protein